MRHIKVYSRLNACLLVGDANTAVISISVPGKPAELQDGWCEILRLEFHDVDPKWGLADGMQPFTERMADSVVEFAERHKDKDMVIHCDAGVSRSVAVGLFISTEWGGELYTHEIGTTDAANGHVLRTLYHKMWLSHFGDSVKTT